MRVSVRWKFTWFIAVLLLFTIGILSIYVLKGISDYQRTQTERALEKQVEMANIIVRQQYVTGTRFEPKTFMGLQGQKLAVEIGASSGMRVSLYDPEGVEVGDSLPMAEKADIHEALQYALQNKIAYFAVGDTLEYMAPLQSPDGLLGVIHFQAFLHEQHAFYRNILNLFLVAGFIVLGISFLFGLLYMTRQAKDISRLKDAADQIRRGDYMERPSLQRRDELGDLSLGIYDMSLAIQSNIVALNEEKDKLQVALQKLQQLEQQQKQFIHNVSHELKTPLTSIQAYVDLLHMYDDDPSLIKEAREAIAQESSRLYELVEKVLQLAALEKYEFDYHPERVDLKPLLANICLRLKGKADKFGISILPELQSVHIWADRDSLIHIFVNLLDNAIKYNLDQGSVTVRTDVGQDFVEVAFIDTGVGIPPERRELIFEPFYTVNKDRSRQSGGTGLGLALVRQLVDRQGGQVRVEEAAGQGTRMIVTFVICKL
ncbi:sensor histidine kinase [Paenibacillus eucommiae]|uniref:histidine kinase n=1 Tax=Paenibacillus eucommiae TaxID=1355755 RepID=A0ABS4IR15_9BACL|nr:HAMP domain-containing sensor histidine kinase [Paenibacillus eucommiae]MBP1990018.1 signal transduction histidine kinase [Paenibacillus eucommiae]